MKKQLQLFLALLIITALQSFAQSPNWLWAKSAGGTNDDYGKLLAIDAFGNVYMIGAFQGTVDFDPGAGTFNLTSVGSTDIFICKLDISGNFLWAKAMGGTISDFGNSIALDVSDNVYATGYFQGTVDFDPGAGVFNLTSAGSKDIFISKLDSTGNFIWAKSMGGISDNVANSIVLDAFGNIYTTGVFSLTADFDPGAGTFNLTSAGGNDIFISKLDSSGNFVWAKRMGASGYDFGLSLALDINGSGNINITGGFEFTVDFNPGTGTFNLNSAGLRDIFISKLDSAGNFLWAKAIGGTSNDNVQSIKLDVLSNVYTTGEFQGTTDFDPGTGTFNLNSAGSNDIFISKLNSSGNFVWAKRMGAASG
ncbi:MAG: hypothetical protein ABI855_16225, partial [Bacteroidota bacterium]